LTTPQYVMHCPFECNCKKFREVQASQINPLLCNIYDNK